MPNHFQVLITVITGIGSQRSNFRTGASNSRGTKGLDRSIWTW
jgi:hypothetical protein